MKKVLILVVLAFVAYSCASTKTSKKAVDIAIGSWNYVVSNTPEGDVTGVMVISKEGDVYSGVLNTSQGSSPLENVTVTDNNLACTFNYMGYTIDITGLFAGATFTGKCTVEYNDFPMTATRQEAQ
jgi:hypothetical protein